MRPGSLAYVRREPENWRADHRAFNGGELMALRCPFPEHAGAGVSALTHVGRARILAHHGWAPVEAAQRDDGIHRGVELIEWTFDPLEIKNAHLNIVRLGAIAAPVQLEPLRSSSSPLQGGCRQIA